MRSPRLLIGIQLFILGRPLLLELDLVVQRVLIANAHIVVGGQINLLCIFDVDWRAALALALLIEILNLPLKTPPHVEFLRRNHIGRHCLNLGLHGRIIGFQVGLEDAAHELQL